MGWEQSTSTEKYWSVCFKWGFIPYPCQKTHTVTRWCADYDWATTTGFLFFCSTEGCIDGQLYRWRKGFCFFSGRGSITTGAGRVCLGNRPDALGPCSADDNPEVVERGRVRDTSSTGGVIETKSSSRPPNQRR
jgi:hypothetical protein